MSTGMSAFHRLQELRMRNDEVRFQMDELRPRFDALRDRKALGTAPRAVSSYQLFQTPQELAQELCALLPIETQSRVLEPSAGLGRLLSALPSCESVAVEIAPQCASELYRRFQDTKLYVRDFLELQPEETGLFDFVVMNPPFHMRADIVHIQHALKFLRPEGQLAAICMHTQHREEALRPICNYWQVIPAGAFSKEGTRTETVLLRIRL